MNNTKLISVIILAIGLVQAQVWGQDAEPDFSLVPGTVVHHSPASSGKSAGAPSIVIMPNGDYVVSMNYSSIKKRDKGDIHDTALFKSTDQGVTWSLLAEIDNQRWSTLFYHNDALYLIGTYKAFGNAIIRKSVDGGRSWTEPKDKKSGLLAEGRYHCAPVPVVIHKGRIWRAMEDALKGREFRAFMMSAPVNADLLDADSWTFSNKLPYNEAWFQGKMRGWLEGNAVITPDNEMVNVIRCHFPNGTGINNTAAIIHVSHDGKGSTFNPGEDFIGLPGGTSKKFTIRYDEKAKKYWSLVNWIQPADLKYVEELGAGKIRNTLALVSSNDLKDWLIERVVLYHPDKAYHAFQYVDWLFEDEDIIAVSRTAFDDGLGGADNWHDANFITFHRIKNFRENFNFD